MIKRCSPIININDKRPLFLKVKERQSGAALLYIFMAIALMAILTASMINTSSTSSRPQQAQRLAATLDSQITYIRSAILECVQSYPAGDPTVNSGSITDPGYNAPYPVTPESNHFVGSTLGQAASSAVSELRCPGNPGIDNNHTPLFKGVGGRFAPKAPDAFNFQWTYTNQNFTFYGLTIDGVVIALATDKTDAYIRDAFEATVNNYNSCEAQYIVGNNTNGCPTGYYCLLYWLKRNSGC